MTTFQNLSQLTHGNIAVRSKNYAIAINHYIQALHDTPALTNTLIYNIRIAQQKYLKQQTATSKPHVALCTIENDTSVRLQNLLNFYNEFAELKIIKIPTQPIPNKISEKINGAPAPISTTGANKNNDTTQKLLELVATSPFDIVHFFQLGQNQLLAGILYKIIWKSKIYFDIDSKVPLHEKPEIKKLIDIYLEAQNDLHSPPLTDHEWQKISLALAENFDAITVSDERLQQHFPNALLFQSKQKAETLALKHTIQNSNFNPIAHHLAKLANIFFPHIAGLLQTPDYTGQAPQAKTNTQSAPENIKPTITLDQPSKEKRIITEFEKPEDLDQFYFDAINESGLFDPQWYIAEYSPKYRKIDNPLDHYLKHGVKDGLNPSLKFSTNYYLESNPDIVTAPINPFIHYVLTGINEGRQALPSTNEPAKKNSGLQRPADLDQFFFDAIVESGLFKADWYIKKYQSRYNDIGNPLEHYLKHGVKDSLDPSEAFSTSHYLKVNPDIAAAPINPFIHYVLTGINEGRQALPEINKSIEKNSELQKPADLDQFFFDAIVGSGLFKADWYIKKYQSRYNDIGNPLEHYLKYGVQDSLDPSDKFSTSHYLKFNPDVAGASINPFIHYVLNGIKEGREAVPRPYTSKYEIGKVEYIPKSENHNEVIEKAVRAICFYLPQFHPIPENDKWWGKGFTEWTNVKPARPQFKDHYQPHVPDEYLGYYSLLDRETQAKQIELAKLYGIEAFCYYLYWFSGKRLLEQPLDNMLNDPSLDFPFCVCWANENWSRRWDGLENDLLMVQNYSDEDDINFIKNISKYLKDNRYIRIEGKPLLLIYRPNLFPFMKATASRWRKWCRENGVGEIYLAYPQSFECLNPEEYGFDAAIEFPPNNSTPPNITHQIQPIVENFETTVYDWRVFVERSDAYKNPGYKLFRSATPSWDNTARKKNKGTVFHNSCPKLFEKYLTNAFSETLQQYDKKDERIVFINAWNEWAEGAHLEPDQRYGYAWLQAVKNAHKNALKKRNKILIVSHDAHPHGAQILCLNFAKEFNKKLNFDVEMIVLGDGSLIKKYAQYATVHQLNLASDDPDHISNLLSGLKNKGINLALVNTSVSGNLVPYLKAAGLSVVSLIHELPSILNNYKLQNHANAIAEHSDKIIFPAKQVQLGFEGFINKKLSQAHIRPQGIYLPSILRQGASKEAVYISTREKLGLTADAKIIMCAGYADYRKGFDIFVNACIEVFKKIPNSYALWVGHFDQKFVDESLIAADEAGLKDRFIFTGLVEDPRSYYVAADIYALTSREDPFPSVVMEALDALTPVVAFKDSGGFENLLSRDCGLLVPAGDIPAYAHALIELLDNREQSFELARNGKQIVESELSFHHYLYDLLAFGKSSIPKISVIVPNYNYANYIHSRLESITNQLSPIYELIVLDDVSKDNSLDEIRAFLKSCDLPYKLIVNEQNSGSVFKQWEKGIQIAKGELVWIAEADDLAEPSFLEKLVTFFSDQDVVLSYSQSKQIDQNGNLLAENYLDYTKDVGNFWDSDYICSGEDELKRAFCIKNTIPNVSGVVFRREALVKAMSEAKESLYKFKVAGDWLIYILMAKQGKFAFHSGSLNLHRRHIGSVTNINNHYDEIVYMQEIVKKEVPIGKASLELINNYRKHLLTYFQN